MPAVSAVIGHGQGYSAGVATFMVDESSGGNPSLLIQSISFSVTRQENRYKGANRATQYAEYSDPSMDIAIDAFVIQLVDLAIEHPGTAVTTAPLTYGSNSFHGMVSSDGTMIYIDPTTTGSTEEMRRCSFTIRQLPFVGE
jgi:hypothetical protein